MRVAGFLLAGAVASSGAPAVAQDRERSEHEQRVYDIYRGIIAFRTAIGHGQVDEMVSYLTERLSEAGFANQDIMVTDYDSEDEPTQGLTVRYRGDGSSGEKPIVLLAHMDMVDALPEDWVRDPFTLTEDNGYFNGRGTMDNKYGVANLTGTFIRLMEEGWIPNCDLYLVFPATKRPAWFPLALRPSGWPRMSIPPSCSILMPGESGSETISRSSPSGCRLRRRPSSPTS